MNTYKLPSEFIELNKLTTQFNCGSNVTMFGEGYYLLLQGSKVKSYSLYLCESKIGSGRIVNALVCSENKKGIIRTFDLLERLLQPTSNYLIQRN